MATFAYNTVLWTGDDRVHIVWNSVWERSSRYALCGAVVGAGPIYDRIVVRGDLRAGKELVASCPGCLARRLREGDRWIAPLDKPVAPPID
jgi:hypothetical protein